MRLSLVLATLVALSFIPTASAQCYRTSSYATVIHAPTVYTPTYYTPPYTPYVSQHYDQYTNTAIVGAAYPVVLPLLSYTSLADDVRSYYSTRKATKDAYLEALREAAAEGIFGTAQPPPPQPFVPPPGVERAAVNPNPSVPNPGTPPAVPKAPGTSLQIGKLLQTRCASCHNPSEPNHVDLSIPADKIDGAVRALCVVWTADKSMPKKGEPLSQQEYDLVQSWAKSAPVTFAKAIPQAQPADKK